MANIPPTTSIPRERGHTSMTWITTVAGPSVFPVDTAPPVDKASPCIAAPYVTASATLSEGSSSPTRSPSNGLPLRTRPEAAPTIS